MKVSFPKSPVGLGKDKRADYEVSLDGEALDTSDVYYADDEKGVIIVKDKKRSTRLFGTVAIKEVEGNGNGDEADNASETPTKQNTEVANPGSSEVNDGEQST